MEEVNAKRRAAKAVEELPEDATLDDAIEKLVFLRKKNTAGAVSVAVASLLLVVTLPGFGPAGSQSNPPAPVTVMSYNIRYDEPRDGIDAWPNRRDNVAELIGERYAVDIAGLQEALKSQIDDLQERLTEYAWVGVGRDDGAEGGEYSPIFYRSDRFELLEHDTFWLSETPDVPGSMSWDTAITRIVTWARFRDRETDRTFVVFNTHFDHRGEVARVESARLLAGRVMDVPEDVPVIITGDLNVPETSEAYAVFADAPRLHDARYASETGHEGPTATFNNWVELREPESRIDYIFVSDGVRVLSHRIIDDRFGGRFPSDHLPVLAEVLLP